MSAEQQYVLGSDLAELARLDAQAAAIAQPTRHLLQAAGLRPGQRVLDLGCGLGHVSRLAAELVGPDGHVTGLDADPRMLEEAERRCREAGVGNVRFVEGDVRTWRGDEVDAVIGRLILFYLPDAADVVRHHAESLTPGGLAAFVDYDCGSTRSEPELPLFERLMGYVMAAFRSAGADPVVGARLGMILREAGLEDVTTFGIQAYVPPGDPLGWQLLAGVIRSLAPQIERAGIATAEELGLETLAERLEAEIREHDAITLPPAVAGAWGRRG